MQTFTHMGAVNYSTMVYYCFLKLPYVASAHYISTADKAYRFITLSRDDNMLLPSCKLYRE